MEGMVNVLKSLKASTIHPQLIYLLEEQFRVLYNYSRWMVK